ncbi:hypothetical protein [Maliponia aquimaris]|uniref:Uncharacterized protein n=1 Tax=Maliponia aquimaris TaxID=1673631 RepID=A0A238L689_9RHOB|nr:hypothetical protein [Maliponia aquimaris]SMX50498.1 hypothetical protein MAA8898_04814 [Maliponia aquimaris]
MLLAVVLLGAFVTAHLILSPPSPKALPVRVRARRALSRIGHKR